MKKRLLSSIIIFGLLFIVFLSIFSINAQGFFRFGVYRNCILDSGGYNGRGYFFPPGIFGPSSFHCSNSSGMLRGLGVIHDHSDTDPLWINSDQYGRFRAFLFGFTGDVVYGFCDNPPCGIVSIQGIAKFVLIYSL